MKSLFGMEKGGWLMVKVKILSSPNEEDYFINKPYPKEYGETDFCEWAYNAFSSWLTRSRLPSLKKAVDMARENGYILEVEYA